MSILVSVIIPTYKRYDKLKRAIESVLNQTYSNIELIVVDDNSPGTTERYNTESLMNLYKENSNIIYIKHDKNKNGAAARNTGLSIAKGKYIAFLDDDDEFMVDKIKYQVELLENKDISWGACYTKFVRKKDGKLLDRGIEDNEGYLTRDILKGILFISSGSNILIKKDIADKVGGFNESFQRRQDIEFLLRVSKITKIAHVDRILLIIHKDDKSNRLSGLKLEDNIKHFLEVFDSYIKELPKNEQEDIIKSLYMDLIRYYLVRFNMKKISEVAREYNISNTTIFRYILYLLKRKFLKQCYGFKI